MSKIILTESKLKAIISESVRKALNEWTDIATFPREFLDRKDREWKLERLKKEAEKRPDLDPAGFQWFGNVIRHNDKKKPKAVPRQKITKPEGMGDREYEQKYVIPNNPKYKEKLEMYADEEFLPVVNGGRYFGGAVDYGCDYEISNRGRLKVINHSDAIKSDIYDPYPAPTRKAMQFTMIGYGDDEEGARTRMRTTPSVSYMVANAFLGEHDPSKWVVKHKDGDWHNNNVENLEWVPKKNGLR